MHDNLFCQLEDWNHSNETLNEYTEIIGRLTSLPSATYDIMENYKAEVRREMELWQNLSPRFESRHHAALAFAAEVEKRNKE